MAVGKGTFKRHKQPREEQTLEQLEEQLGEELERGVAASRGQGENRRVVKDIGGAVEAVKAWGAAMMSARKKAQGVGKKAEDRDSLSGAHRREMGVMRRNNPRMKYARADKGGAMIYAEVAFLIRQALTHVQDKEAYRELRAFAGDIGRGQEEEPREFEGAEEEGGGRRMWKWALDRVPRQGKGEWETKEQIVKSLFVRMEDFVNNELRGLPEEIKDDLLMQQDARGGGKEASTARAQVRLTLMEVIMKLHKPELASRPVGRAFASQLRPMETLLGRTLMSVLAEREQKRLWEEPRAKKIILRDSRELVEELEEMNGAFRRARAQGDGRGGEDERMLVLVTYDVASMYPSMKRLVRAVDTVMAESEKEGASEEERAAAGKLREVVVKLLIFLLQHQIVSVPREEEEGLDFYLQHEGIGIGQGSSGAVATIG